MITSYKEVYDTNINYLNEIIDLLECKFDIKCGIIYEAGLNLFYIEFATNTTSNEPDILIDNFTDYLDTCDLDNESNVLLNHWYKYNANSKFNRSLSSLDQLKFLLNNELYDDTLNEIIFSFIKDNLEDLIRSFNEKQNNTKYILPNPFISFLLDILKYLDKNRTEDILHSLSTFIK